MNPRVTVQGLRVAFGGVEVVKGVDLNLFPGEVHAIVGENGAGKSTVAKVIAGVHQPASGTILLDGQPISHANPRAAIERGIALIHQEPLTFPDLDVAENIFVGHQPQSGPLKSVDWRAMRQRAQEILTELGVTLDPSAQVGRMSVADQQMVELAAALSHKANVLLMDETTAALTPKEVDELFAIIRRLKAQGCAIGFVSHHLEEIMEIADRITVMRDGEKVAELVPSQTSIEEIVRLMVGRDVTIEKHDSQEPGEALLSVSHLTGPGFRDISFQVRAGEIVGLGGLVGAGRTEVCQAIFGVTHPTGGTLETPGKQGYNATPRAAMARGLAMVPEDRQHAGLHTSLPIAQNTTLALLPKLFKRKLLNARAETDLADTKVRAMGTAFRSVSQPVRELSGGNQQKVVLAKWLLTEPKVLILDEPTRGVDVGAKAEVHRLMRDLAAQGFGILMVSSDLPELLALSDRILVMKEGKVTAELKSTEATADKVMLAATGQEAHHAH